MNCTVVLIYDGTAMYGGHGPLIVTSVPLVAW